LFWSMAISTRAVLPEKSIQPGTRFWRRQYQL
jgi:hypothetical protein